MFDSSDRLSDRSDEAFTRYDRRTDQADRPVPTGDGPTTGTCKHPVSVGVHRAYGVPAQFKHWVCGLPSFW